jgi:hypothetical protein
MALAPAHAADVPNVEVGRLEDLQQQQVARTRPHSHAPQHKLSLYATQWTAQVTQHDECCLLQQYIISCNMAVHM